MRGGRASLRPAFPVRVDGTSRQERLDYRGRRLRVEGEVELVLLGNVEPQDGMEHVEGPPNIHEIFGLGPFAREAVHEPFEHSCEMKALLMRLAHRGQRIIPARVGLAHAS
jgi:hypothetical protein